MTVSGALARPLMAGVFVYGGLDALRDPESKAKAADDVAPMIAQALRLPMTDTVTLVRVNGGIQVVAGTMLAMGKARRLSALVLAASLVPTTYAGHRFWEEVDEERRAVQRIHFLKNVAMLGGLVLAAGDTGGRPSVPWRARRAARHAVAATAAASAVTGEAAKHVLDVTWQAPQSAAEELSRRARKMTRQAAQKTRQAELAELAEQAKELALAAKRSDLTRRARKAAHKAELELTKWAGQAAQRASENVKRAQLGAHATAAASGAASRLQQVGDDAVGWAREAVGDGAVARVRESATSAAHQVVERAKDALPVAS